MTQRIFSASHLGQLRYDLIWVQRVLLYLTDADLLAVLERLRGALRPNGVLIIKENCLLKSNTSGCLEQIQGWRSKAQGRLVQVNKMTLCASDAMAVFPISFTYRHTHKLPHLPPSVHTDPAFQGHYRRKFRSQTSENMDRWKSRGGKSQRREEKKKEDQRRERVRGKKMQMREKVEKLRKTVFFQ